MQLPAKEVLKKRVVAYSHFLVSETDDSTNPGLRIRSAFPRIIRRTSFAECMHELRQLGSLRQLSLPPLEFRDDVDFKDLRQFPWLSRLDVNGVSLLKAEHRFDGPGNLEVLKLNKVSTTRPLLESISELEKLKELYLETIGVEEAPHCFIRSLPQELKILKIDNCPQITNEGLEGLNRFIGLDMMMLGVDQLSDADCVSINFCWADEVCLKIYGKQDLDKLAVISSIVNLTRLEFEEVKNCRMPEWVLNMDLKELKFKSGMVSPTCLDFGLPSSLVSLGVNIPVLPRWDLMYFLSFAERLRSLTLVGPIITRRNFSFAGMRNLVYLEIIGRELDGDVAKSVTSKKLQSLHIGGCLSLKGDHLSHLALTGNLKSLSVSNSHLNDDCLTEVAKIRSLRSLSLNFCPYLTDSHFCEMPFLDRLEIRACIGIEHTLESFLSRPFIGNLHFLGFKFVTKKTFPIELEMFCNHNYAVSVDPDIELNWSNAFFL